MSLPAGLLTLPNTPSRMASACTCITSLRMLCAQVVSDQVRLWQADTQRVRVSRAVLYDDFPSAQVFRMSAARARELGAWLWEDAARHRPPGRGRRGA